MEISCFDGNFRGSKIVYMSCILFTGDMVNRTLENGKRRQSGDAYTTFSGKCMVLIRGKI